MVTLKPNTPYAPISIGMEYDDFQRIVDTLPTTDDQLVDVEMTGGGSKELAAFRFGPVGTTFLADRDNVIGFVIEEAEVPKPPNPDAGTKITFQKELIVTGFAGTIGVIGVVDNLTPPADYKAKVVSLTLDDTPGSIKPVGAKYSVMLFDTRWHSLNTPLEPTADYPIDVPLIDPEALYQNAVISAVGQVIQVGLSADVEPSNIVDNPAMRITIEFEVVE